MDKYNELCKRISNFNEERDWNKFHSPSNIAKSISIEAAELLECFQWDNEKYDIEHVKEELADVFNYCIQMSQVLHIDLIDIENTKIDKNELKYPVNKAKGLSKKYNEL